MKNKIRYFIIVVILNFSIIIDVNSNEPFNFNVTELEIIDNGDTIKGYKGGTATTDNGLKIKADTFVYDKVLNILNAFGNVKITDEINDYVILSEKITYIKNQEKIFTKGETEAILESRYNFLSKNVLLLKNEMILSSNEKSSLKDKDIYLYRFDKFNYSFNDGILKAKKIEIISNYKKSKDKKDFYFFEDGILDIKNKNFTAGNTKIKIKKDSFENSKNDPRIYGVSSKKKGEITTIKKGIFTSCALNDDCPPWSINSSEIVHDSKKKQIIYKNALLKIYDFPVLYFPKFFHPDPSVSRQSGFLQPQLNNSNILGSSFRIPYFHVLSENKDLTFTPSIFDKDIYMIQNEYRQENENSSLISDLGFAKGYKSVVTDKKKKNIGHLFAKFDLNLDLESFIKSDLRLSLENVTNDTYLKVFDSNLTNISPEIMPKNKSQLTSNLELNLDHEKYSFDTGITAYETLSGTDSDRYQYVLPYYTFSKNLITNQLLSLNFNSDGNNNYQNTNNLKTVINNNFDFKSIDFISDSGFKNNIGLHFKNVNTVAKNDSTYKSSPQVELMNIINLESSLPLIKLDNKYSNSIIPKISFRFNPADMKDYSDSDRYIDTNNIFSLNRLAISDSYETGQSLTIGVDYKKETIDDINKFFEFNLATVLRDVKQDTIPTKSTLGEKQSNLFGKANYGLSKMFSLNYDFALDNDLQTFEHNSIGTVFNFDKLITSFDFVETGGKMGDTNFITNTTKFIINEDNFLSFNTRRNRKISLTEYYDLVYEYKNDCLVAGIKYKKTYYQDRDLIPAEDLLFSITLFPLTTYETKVDQDLYRN
jgi:LPS-assembly protein